MFIDEAATFVDAVVNAAHRDDELDRLRRRELASRNSWEAKTKRLLEPMSRELESCKHAA